MCYMLWYFKKCVFSAFSKLLELRVGSQRCFSRPSAGQELVQCTLRLSSWTVLLLQAHLAPMSLVYFGSESKQGKDTYFTLL